VIGILKTILSRFLPPSRRRPESFGNDIVRRVPKSQEKKFPASMPREMYWSNEVGGIESCPRCRSSLESEYLAYMMAVRMDKEIEPFITGSDHGYFCSKCPVVVLDREAFGEIPLKSLDITPPFDLAVIGIVDIDGIPEDKKNIPLGDDDNPVPLVAFLKHGGGKRTAAGGKSTKKKKKGVKSHKAKNR
jgi:hypothetical protein